MGTVVFLIILMLLTIAGFCAAFFIRRANKKIEKISLEKEDHSAYDDNNLESNTLLKPWIAFTASTGLALITILSLIGSMYHQVPTKEYGVITSFGKPDGVLSNGIHFIAPWKSVTEMDASIQTDNHTADKKDCINVRIAHQATACVDASIRWRIKSNATDALFQNYRQFENIRESLVDRELSATLNTEFADYDALGVDAKGNMTAPALSDIAKRVTTDMQKQVGTQIDVLSVIIPVIKFDENTQSKVNALLSQVAQTRIAQQNVHTNEAQAKANEVLANSVSKDPNVLVSKCLDIVESGKVSIPAGFSCWPSNGSNSIVVPSAK